MEVVNLTVQQGYSFQYDIQVTDGTATDLTGWSARIVVETCGDVELLDKECAVSVATDTIQIRLLPPDTNIEPGIHRYNLSITDDTNTHTVTKGWFHVTESARLEDNPVEDE